MCRSWSLRFSLNRRCRKSILILFYLNFFSTSLTFIDLLRRSFLVKIIIAWSGARWRNIPNWLHQYIFIISSNFSFVSMSFIFVYYNYLSRIWLIYKYASFLSQFATPCPFNKFIWNYNLIISVTNRSNRWQKWQSPIRLIIVWVLRNWPERNAKAFWREILLS